MSSLPVKPPGAVAVSMSAPSSVLPDLPAFADAQLQEAADAARRAAEMARQAAMEVRGKRARTAAGKAVKRADRMAREAADALRAERQAEEIVPAVQRRPISWTVLKRAADGGTIPVRLTLRGALVEVRQAGDTKRVRSVARANLLESMRRRGADVQDWHLEAANRYRVDWDVARHGCTPPEQTGKSAPGPRTGFSEAACEQARADALVRRGQRAMWPDEALVHWVVLSCGTIPDWCANLEAARGRSFGRAEEQGRLLAALDRLARSYGIAVALRTHLG